MFSYTDELECLPVVATAEDSDCRHLKPNQEEYVTKLATDIKTLSGSGRRVLESIPAGEKMADQLGKMMKVPTRSLVRCGTRTKVARME